MSCLKRSYQLSNLLFAFVLLTALVTGALPAQGQQQINTLIVGGGSAHDFQKWWGEKDVETLKEAGINAAYTEDPGKIKPALQKIDVLVLSNNKPIPGDETRDAIFEFVKNGGGLVLLHAATWYNWGDWPEFNKKLVSGGARGHVHTSPFEVNLTNPDHPILTDVSKTFQITDELYYFESDQNGPPINILARGTHKKENKTYPVIWTVDAYKGRILCNSLGHDGRAHKQEDYQQILVNSLRWAANHGNE